jgi:hypothetical protein
LRLVPQPPLTHKSIAKLESRSLLAEIAFEECP